MDLEHEPSTLVCRSVPGYVLDGMRASAREILAEGNYRSHGLGMLQFELPEHFREIGVHDAHLHVWHPSLVRFPVEATGHHHRFSMFSTLLCGKVKSIELILVPGDDYDIVAFEGEDQQTVVHKGKTSVIPHLFEIATGQAYYMPYKTYHQFPVEELAITWVTKTMCPNWVNQALFPKGQTPRHSRDPDMQASLIEDSKKVLAMARDALSVR